MNVGSSACSEHAHTHTHTLVSCYVYVVGLGFYGVVVVVVAPQIKKDIQTGTVFEHMLKMMIMMMVVAVASCLFLSFCFV